MPQQQFLASGRISSRRSLKRWNGDVDHAQAIVEIFTETSLRNGRRKSRWVAAMTRTFTFTMPGAAQRLNFAIL